MKIREAQSGENMICIAKLCGTKQGVKANKEGYDEYIAKISQSSKLYWRDGKTNVDRKIDYFPQGYIIEMASKSKKIKRLVEDILCEDAKTNEDLSEIREKNATEGMQIHQYFFEYQKKQYELDTLKDKLNAMGDRDGVIQEIKKIEGRIEELKKTIKDGLSDEETEEYKIIQKNLSQLKAKNQQVEVSLPQVARLKRINLFNDIGVSFDDITDEDIRKRMQSEYVQLEKEVQTKWSKMLETVYLEYAAVRERNEQLIHTVEESELYKKAIRVYTENRKLAEENKKLEKEKEKLASINVLQEKKLGTINDINNIKERVIEKHLEFYQTQYDFCNCHCKEIGDVRIEPKVVFQYSDFIRQVSSYFDGRSAKNSEVLNYQYKKEGYEEFVKKLLDKMLTDKYIFKGNVSRDKAIEDILSSNPFDIEYDISYQGDELRQMSEGKTAFVILKMLLDFSKNEYPILIDQPEDDLDNRAIFEELVKYLRAKKLNRQIILVTHNPNVVVGADAEEIIVANQEGIGNSNPENIKFAYKCGALENSFKTGNSEILLSCGIREHVCELLEGGNKAFRLREKKYQLI